jgi:N-acyl homoserine lactone hydrolase
MGVTALYPILNGLEILDKSVSTYNIDRGVIVQEPIMAYLLDTSEGWVLIDTGLDLEILRDPARAAQTFTGHLPVVSPEQELLTQLAYIGLAPTAIAMVVITHLHSDHAGGLCAFAHAPVYIQRAEYEARKDDPRTPAQACFRHIDWRLLDGDTELLPGLQLLATPGHTPGHMSVLVDLPHSGPIVLGIDAGDLIENFEFDILPGGHVDRDLALASLRRLKSVTLRAGGRLFPGHDLEFWQRMRTLPESYR